MASLVYTPPGAFLRERVVHLEVGAEDLTVEVEPPVDNALGLNLVAWQADPDLAPTFWPPSPAMQGGDTLDFSLANSNVNGGAPTLFSVQLPNRFVSQEEVAPLLQDLVSAAVAADPAWADVTMSVDLYARFLRVHASTDITNGLAYLSTLRLLFASGPNAARACPGPLGFDAQDYSSHQRNDILSPFGVASVVAARPFGQPFRYLDLLVASAAGGAPDSFRLNLSNVTLRAPPRARIDTEDPPRKLARLDVRIRLPGAMRPSLYGGRGKARLSLSVLAWDVAGPKPAYVQQALQI